MKTNYRRSQKITIIGIMVAITFVLAYTPFGMIPFPTLQATTLHIPTIIVSILLGPVEGAITGFFFGLITLIKAFTPTSVLEPFFMNPLISVLPRILVGIVPYFVYKFTFKLNVNAAIILGSALGSLTNTVAVLFMMYIIYASQISEKLGVPIIYFIGTTVGTSGIVEMVLAILVCFPAIKALRKVLR